MKDEYQHYMLKEISEQPKFIKRIIKKYIGKDTYFIDKEILNALKNANTIYIIASGSSYHAGLIGKSLFEKLARKKAESIIASEFVYNMPLIDENSFFLIISQSGETGDLKEALSKIKDLGYKTLTITNTPDSYLSKNADYSLFLEAGKEVSIPATKSFIATLALLSILANSISGQPINIKEELLKVASTVQNLYNKKAVYQNIANSLKDNKLIFLLGTSFDFYATLEISLKLKETAYIPAFALPIKEFFHGPITLLEEGTSVIILNTLKESSKVVRNAIKEISNKEGKVVIISLEDISESKDNIIIPQVHFLFTSFVTVVLGQLIAYYTALARNTEIDNPRNLTKSVPLL